MFKISPIKDKETQKREVEECGASFREDFFAYAMKDAESGELMGISQFEIDSQGGYISDIKEAPNRNDFEAMFILGRATMNFIDSCGAHICRAAKYAADATLLRGIGFTEKDGEYFSDMTGFFDGKCSSCK